MPSTSSSLKKISYSITDPFAKSPTLVVFEQSDRLVKMSLVQTVKKTINIHAVFYHQASDSSQWAVLRAIESLTKKHLSANRSYRYLVLTDHHLITTSRSGVSLVRPEPEVKITSAEVQNLISKSLWKIFSNQRIRASKKTETADINLALVDAEFIQVRLNKSRVMDPIGFRAKTFEFWAKQTIADKKFLKNLYSLIPEEEIIFFCEAAGLVSDLIFSNSKQKEDFLLVIIGRSETAFYRSRGKSFYYIDKIDWGTDKIFDSLCRLLGLAKEQAQEVFNLYQTKAASPAVIKKLNDLISEEVAIPLKGIEQYQKKSNFNKVYLYSALSVPELFNNQQLKKRIDIQIKFQLVNKRLIGQNFDFDLKLNKTVKKNDNCALLIGAVKHLESKKTSSVLEKITQQRCRLLKDA